MNTTPSLKAKLAKFTHDNLPDLIGKAAVHPLFCKLNLHNNSLLKKINSKACDYYSYVYHGDALVRASFNCGGDDILENSLIAIERLSRNNNLNTEFVFKRINFIVNEGLQALYDRNHQEWIKRIDNAIHESKTTTSTSKLIKKPKITKKNVQLRNKKGQFVSTRKHRK